MQVMLQPGYLGGVQTARDALFVEQSVREMCEKPIQVDAVVWPFAITCCGAFDRPLRHFESRRNLCQEDQVQRFQSLKKLSVAVQIRFESIATELAIVHVNKRDGFGIFLIEKQREGFGEIVRRYGLVRSVRSNRQRPRLNAALLRKIRQSFLLCCQKTVLAMIDDKIQTHEPDSHGGCLMLTAIAVILIADGFVYRFRLEVKQVPILTEDFAASMALADQPLDKNL